MAKSYLLPCAKCERRTQVSPSQAGDTITCACGAAREVPPMRELAKLELAAGQAEDLPPIWGLRQGLIFLGLVILVCGLVFSGYLYSQRPVLAEAQLSRSSDDAIRQEIDQYTLNQLWSLWLHLDAYGIVTPDSPAAIAFQRGMETLWRQITLGLGVAAIGAAIAAGGLFVKAKR